MSEQQQTDKKVWFGVLLIIVGGFWLLDNLNINIIPYYISDVLISWKTFLILLGVYFIFGKKKPEPGFILIAIGGVFLLQDFDFFRVRDIMHIFWPVVIIIVGTSIILRRGGHVFNISSSEKKNDVDYLDDFALFGGGDKTIQTQNFKGGKVSAMFGGSEIDLRQSDLQEGTSVLDLFIMFGGTSIIVPPDWTIKVEPFALFGGFSDDRSSAINVVPNKDKVLVIKGFIMFGGASVAFNK